MKIADIYKSRKTVISLEIFPPKPESDINALYATLDRLSALNPGFISVTYSAGGSGSVAKTVELAQHIKEKYGIESLAHRTCLNSTPEQLDEAAEIYRSKGLENMMCLRGDIPEGVTVNGPFYYASDLISYIKKNHSELCLGGGAYPEGHIDCETMELSIEHLKMKVDAGADFLVTQLCFDNRKIYEFLDRTITARIDVPISFGIMPILSKARIEKMVFMNGVSMPSDLTKLLGRYENDPESLEKAALDYSANQINDLAAHRVDGIHIYTMNRPGIAEALLGRYRFDR